MIITETFFKLDQIEAVRRGKTRACLIFRSDANAICSLVDDVRGNGRRVLPSNDCVLPGQWIIQIELAVRERERERERERRLDFNITAHYDLEMVRTPHSL